MNDNKHKINNGIMTDNSLIDSKEEVKIKEKIHKIIK